MATWPYRELVGALGWLELVTRPAIATATSSLARFARSQSMPSPWEAARRALRYLKGIKGKRLKLGGNQLLVEGYKDADDAVIATIGARSECMLLIYSVVLLAGRLRSRLEWRSGPLKRGLWPCQVAKESVWMTEFLEGPRVWIHDVTVMNVDNQASIARAPRAQSSFEAYRHSVP